MRERFAKRFKSRELLNRSGILELTALVEGLSNLEEFQDFYGKCVQPEDALDVPFINRNLLVTRSIWQSNYQRLLAASKSETPQS